MKDNREKYALLNVDYLLLAGKSRRRFDHRSRLGHDFCFCQRKK